MNQHFAIEISTAPATEPLTLVEMRAHARLTSTGSPATHPEDDLLQDKFKAARESVEDDTGRALITQTVKQYLDHWPWDGVIRLMRNPVQLTSPETVVVTYKDQAGDTQTWGTSNYIVDYKSVPARITLEINKSFPTLRGLPNDVIITFPAGYGAAGTVPFRLKAATALLGAHLYENRESTAGTFGGGDIKVVPMGYDNLIFRYKVWDW